MKDNKLKSIYDECMGLRIKKLDRIVNRIYDQTLAPFGITISQFNLLVAVSLKKEARPADLGKILLIERSSLSRNLERLEKDGLVKIIMSEGGRAQTVCPTAMGVKKLEASYEAWASAQEVVIELLGSKLVNSIKQRVDSPDFAANDN